MKFTETPLEGAWVLDVEPIGDDRGFFTRWYCTNELADHGLEPTGAQGNLSYNGTKGTMRGMHMQLPPAAEIKLVRCIAGAVFDVIVDVRPDSPTRWESFGIELSAANRRAVYVPQGFLHGYLTLAPDTEVMYQVSEFYTPGLEAGLRYDDPDLGLEWPLPVELISDKDAGWPLLSELDRDGFGSTT